MRALGKITPGKLLGLEVHVAAIQAEEDLREIAAFNTSFGGEQAKRHVEWLKDRLDEYARLTTGESADADRFASAEEMPTKSSGSVVEMAMMMKPMANSFSLK